MANRDELECHYLDMVAAAVVARAMRDCLPTEKNEYGRRVEIPAHVRRDAIRFMRLYGRDWLDTLEIEITLPPVVLQAEYRQRELA